jgi:hypothetical protein
MQFGLFEKPTFRTAPKTLTARAEARRLFFFLWAKVSLSRNGVGRVAGTSLLQEATAITWVGRAGRAGVQGTRGPTGLDPHSIRINLLNRVTGEGRDLRKVPARARLA